MSNSNTNLPRNPSTTTHNQSSDYTDKQEVAVNSLMVGIEDYFNQLISYNGNNFKTGLELSHDPEWMSKLVDYWRAKDACFAYLIAPWMRHIGHSLDSHSETEIDQFLAIHDPQDIAHFFMQENQLKDYILANEYDQPDTFDHDPIYQKAYNQFFTTGSITPYSGKK